ncbi:MAG: glycosyltransferase [Verrucomicrobia bacterium]|nr:glycosyltransferase [Verrucomicrobiota bacterium]MBU4291022.1 glycosyltransferase [Verrucomicrobiota bacterium]MBU4429895.1 glycosyltransferase [Verrucomicrobiota bacterium]MCG2678912.1 glycosyltransferase [Kiritimatiellia bacterium]
MNTDSKSPTSRVSVVIPVLNAAAYLPALLNTLFAQKPAPPRNVVLVDSLSTDDTRTIGRSYNNVRIVPIARFSHGAARNLGAREAEGDIIVLLTQDALPRDTSWLEALLRPFSDPQVGAVYSRQIPHPDAPPTEHFFLDYHFPPHTSMRRVKTGEKHLGLEDVFFSNVSAAVRRPLLLRYPFDETLIMSEDQQFARDLIEAGYAVVYAPDSVVVHSHRYSLKTAFRRYFDSVYSLTVIFPQHGMVTSAAMGWRYLKQEFNYILKRHPRYFPYYCLYTLAKISGTVAGHFATRLPRPLLKKLSLHSYHWADNP